MDQNQNNNQAGGVAPQQPVQPVQQPQMAQQAVQQQQSVQSQQPYIPQQPMNAAGNAPSPKKSKKILGFLAGGLVLLGLLAFVVATMFGKTDAQSDLNTAMQKMIQLEDSSIDITFKDQGSELVIKVQSDSNSNNVKISLGEGLDDLLGLGPNLGVEMILSEDSAYVKTSGAESLVAQLVAFGGSSSDLEELGLEDYDGNIDGVWYRIDEEVVMNMFGSILDEDDLKELEEVTEQAASEQLELARLAEIYQQHPIFVVGEKLETEDIRGYKSDKYDIEIAPEDVFNSFTNAVSEQGLDDEGIVGGLYSDLEDMLKETDRSFVWLAGEDLIRLQLGDGSSDIIMDFEYSGDIDLSTPTDSVDFDKSFLGGFFTSIVSDTFLGVQERAEDTERKVDINSIYTQLEVYYTDNGAYPTAEQLDDTAWIQANLPAADPEAFIAPGNDVYTYDPESCSSDGCERFTLSADLEEDGQGLSDRDGITEDYSKESLN